MSYVWVYMFNGVLIGDQEPRKPCSNGDSSTVTHERSWVLKMAAGLSPGGELSGRVCGEWQAQIACIAWEANPLRRCRRALDGLLAFHL